MKEKLRNAGIDAVGNISWGTHFCQFYQTKEDLLNIVIPYFKAGLENNEFCIWVTSDIIGVEEAKKVLKKSIANIDSYLKKGQIEIFPFTDFCSKEKIFDTQKILEVWINKLNQALTNGYDGLRAAANNYLLEKESWNNFLDYEEKLDAIINKHQMIVLCPYCLDARNAIDIIEISKNHQFVLAKKQEKWECVENSVRRNITQHNQTREQLIESKKVYQNIGELIPYGIWICGPDGVVIYLSDSFLDMVGMTLDECKQFGWTDKLPPEDVEKTIADWKHCIETGCFWDYEHHIRGKDGKYYTILSRGVPINDDEGQPTLWVGINLDITERKRVEEALREAHEEIQVQSEELQASNEELQAQSEELQAANEELQAQTEELQEAYEALSESEKRYRLLFEYSMDAIIVVDPRDDGKILSANPAACHMLGGSEKELIGKGRDVMLDLNDPALSALLNERKLSGSARTQLAYRRKDGTTFIGELSTSLFTDINGEPRAIAIIRDITERKQAEETLRKSEEHYRMLFVNMTNGFGLLEVISNNDHKPYNYRYLEINPAFESILGIKKEQLLDRTMLEIFPNASPIALEKYGEVAFSGKPINFEIFSQVANKYLDIYAFSPEKGKVALILRDATERKQLEEQIQQKAEELETVMEMAPAAIWIGHDPQCHNITGNQMANEFYEAEDGENVSANITPVRRFFFEGRGLDADELPMQQSVLKDSDIKNVEFDVLLPSGKWITLLGSASPLHDAEGMVRGSVGTFIDITERKRNEEKLQQALKKAEEGDNLLSVLMENVPEGITIADASGRLRMVSKRGEELLGGTHANKSIDEVVTQWKIYQPDGITPMAAEDTPLSRAVQKGEAVRDAELVQINTQGKKMSLLCNAAPILDVKGNVTGGIVAWNDITERKEAEKALSLAYEQIQIQSEELQVQNEELQDQSERLKEINEALRESEERYRMLFRAMDQGFCIIEMLFDENQKPIDYLFVETNPAFERHTGLENVVGKRIRELAPENEEFWYEIYGKVALTGESVRFEDRAKALNRWYEVYAYRIGQPESRKVAILFNDITERKQMEEVLKKTHDNLEEKIKERTKQLAKAYKSLKESERGLAEAQKMAHIGNWSWNLLTGEIHWSDEKYRIFGLKPQELKITYDLFLSFVHPEDKDYLDKLNRRASKGEPYSVDFRITPANGIERVVHEQCEVIFDEKNTPVRIQGTTQDITERKKTEKALAELETARLKEIHHRIKNNLQVISSLLDLQAEDLDNKADLTHAEILEAFRESQDRVASIALIHEELYAGKGTDSLNFSLYLQKLVKSLFQTYRVGNTYISLKLDLPENIFFDMDNAIPLGIIVNELVSNSLKHAFPGRDKGEIQIKITSKKEFSDKPAKAGIEENNNEENNSENNSAKDEKAEKPGINNVGTNESARVNYTLIVSDNGTGIPENLDLENSKTLGLQLVSILTDQLDGKLELKRNSGTEFSINFSLEEN